MANQNYLFYVIVFFDARRERKNLNDLLRKKLLRKKYISLQKPLEQISSLK